MDNYYIHPEDITAALLAIAGKAAENIGFNMEDIKPDAVEDIIYDLRTHSENPYNRDGFKHLYTLLEVITAGN